MSDVATITEVDLLADVIAPDRADMSVGAAQSVLKWKFSEDALHRMKSLLIRNNQGELFPTEQAELERYRRVGLLVDMIQAKARVSIKRAETES